MPSDTAHRSVHAFPGNARSGATQPAGPGRAPDCRRRQARGNGRAAAAMRPSRPPRVRTLTDAEGQFVLDVPAGVILIEASASGFYPLSAQIDVTVSDAPDTELLLVPRSGFAATVDVVAAPPPPVSAPSAVVVCPCPGPENAGCARQRVPHAADAARRVGHRGVQQPAGGPGRCAGSKPHGHGQRRDPRPLPSVRPDECGRPGDNLAIRAGDRRVQRQVRRPLVVAAGCRES